MMMKIHPYVEVLETTDTKLTEKLIEEWRKETGATVPLWFDFYDDENLFEVRATIVNMEHFPEVDSLFHYMCEHSDLSLHLDWDETPTRTTDFEMRYLDRPSGAPHPVPEDRFNF
ncbi:hypothetical protein [Corynebacterium pseudopelargi]|uniref:Uncharacterized protein n=1 Tax=Corynebacterium pseudopelargi TaxID=2080757 RepID=A0A3G6J091_9CORY|nr:hypothetical protein [Corynebacterium pseudopelargi]AZA09760.1 hypothetical protein CPPEL_08280 [Corynebacterium pseudopelargi]